MEWQKVEAGSWLPVGASREILPRTAENSVDAETEPQTP